MLKAYQTKQKKSIIVNRFLGVFALWISFALFISPARLRAETTAPADITGVTGMMGSGLIWTSDEEGNMSAISNGATSYSYGFGGLAGYWKFDEGTGTTAIDSSGAEGKDYV